jgi:hypothetical protein
MAVIVGSCLLSSNVPLDHIHMTHAYTRTIIRDPVPTPVVLPPGAAVVSAVGAVVPPPGDVDVLYICDMGLSLKGPVH